MRGLHAALAVCLVSSAYCLGAGGKPLLRDSFEGGQLGPGWQVDASAGNTVAVQDGRLNITARLNSYAHVERSVGADDVTASALMQTSIPAGISWSCGLFLYWAPGVWCQLSIIDRQSGQFYTAEALAGHARENYLAQCDRSKPHWLRIELGADVVRFLTRDPGRTEWTCRRVIGRPEEWAGAPKLLILGKGYGLGQGAYPKPYLDNDYSDLGPVTRASFDEVTVEATPAEQLHLRRGELAPTGDVVGERLLAGRADPTYKQVASIYPPMRHVREVVGVRGHPYEIGVDELGALELYAPKDAGQVMSLRATVHVGDDQAAFGSGVRPAKSLLEGHLPIVVARWEHGGVRYRETVLGYSRGMSDREPLFAYVRVEADNCPAGRVVPVSVRVTPDTAQVQPLSGRLEPRDGAAEWAFRVPCPLAPGAKIEPVSASEFDRILDETTRSWRAYLAGGMRILVPDRRLMEAYRAWLAYNAIDVDRVGDAYDPHDGSGFYEAVFGYSAARYAWALDLWGRHDEAAAVLAALRGHQASDGLVDWNFGLTDTGAYLVAVAEHYELTGDAAWLRGYAPSAIAACNWIDRHRHDSRNEGPLVRGLIKHKSYCDYAQPVYGYLHNCYCCVGMERVAAALKAIGMASEADRIAQSAHAYRRDILASMRAATITREGRRIIPMEPDTWRLLKAAGYEARDYYDLIASPLLETGFLAPDSVEAREIADFLREDGGIQMGVCEFGGGIDHAYSFGYLQHMLQMGEPRRYLLGLYSSLAYGMTRQTFSSVECTQIKNGDNALTLPHLYSGTQQLFMLRTLLIRDEGGDLILCSAAPRAWLGQGKTIEVEKAPTECGDLSFRVTSYARGRWITATISKPTRGRPKEVRLVLRHPADKPLRRVVVNGRPWRDFGREAINLTPDVLPCRVVASY